MRIKTFAFLVVLTASMQSVAALNNPFNKTNNMDIGTEVKWQYDNGVASKTSTAADKDGIFYQLKVTNNQIQLQLNDSSDPKTGKPMRFDQFTIKDVQLDGKTSSLFQWCLNNQQNHSRFLQQGLTVKKDVCQNKGGQGLFVMSLNKATHSLLQKTKNLTFMVKAYRTPIEVSFEVSELSAVFARLSGGSALADKKANKEKSVSKYLSKPIPIAAPVVSAPKPVVKAKPCLLKPPAQYPAIKAIEYDCKDDADKVKARKQLAASIKTIKLKDEKLAKEKQLKLKQAEAARLKREAEQKLLDAEKEKELKLISEAESNMQKIRQQVATKMITMCKKKWATGVHRCYCEPYIEHAPAGIESDASCGGL